MQHFFSVRAQTVYPREGLLLELKRHVFAARFREMSGTAKGRRSDRRPATSGENIRDIRGVYSMREMRARDKPLAPRVSGPRLVHNNFWLVPNQQSQLPKPNGPRSCTQYFFVPKLAQQSQLPEPNRPAPCK